MPIFDPPQLPANLESEFMRSVVESRWFTQLASRRGAATDNDLADIAAEIFFSETQDFRSAFLAGVEPGVGDDGALSLPDTIDIPGQEPRLLQAPDPEFADQFAEATGGLPLEFFGNTEREAAAGALEFGLVDVNNIDRLPKPVAAAVNAAITDQPELAGAVVTDLFNGETVADPDAQSINLGMGKIASFPPPELAQPAPPDNPFSVEPALAPAEPEINAVDAAEQTKAAKATAVKKPSPAKVTGRQKLLNGQTGSAFIL